MKESKLRLRLQAGFLFAAAVVEFPVALILSWMPFLAAFSWTSLDEAVYKLPDSNVLSWAMSEYVVQPLGLMVFPVVWLFLFAVLLGLLISNRKKRTLCIPYTWAFVCLLLYPISYFIMGTAEFYPLGGLCVLTFWTLHILIVRILWKYVRIIRQEKRRIPVETAVE